MIRIKWSALALAVVAAPAFATVSGSASVGEAIALAMLGVTAPDDGQSKNHYFPPDNGVRKGGAMQSCGSDDIGQSYPGFKGTYCRISPKAEPKSQQSVRSGNAAP